MCEHKNLDPKVVVVVGGTSSNKGIIVDVWCKECGQSGSAVIEPEDVAWGDEDALADTVPPARAHG